MSRFDGDYADVLDAAAARGDLRSLHVVEPEDGLIVRRGGRRLVNFSGNDYLGLSRHPLLIDRACEWASRYGAGAGSSRLVTGTLDIHHAVEEKLARLKGVEAALILASGWQTNASVVPALVDGVREPALVFTDRLNHASLHHGCAAAGVRQIRFRHNDLAHLEALLSARRDEPARRFILTESVFSMDGDRADVEHLVHIAHRYEAFLYLDEAHATGVLGPNGMGLAGLAPGGVDLAMGTFSKALGSFGAYVAGSRALCDYLVNRASGFIYATALPPAVLGAIDAALDLVPTMGSERQRLARMADYVCERLRAIGIDTLASSTQIIPAVVGSSADAVSLAESLQDAGVLASAIRPPTVPQGTSRIRLSLSAAHSDAQVEGLVDTLIRLWPRK